MPSGAVMGVGGNNVLENIRANSFAADDDDSFPSASFSSSPPPSDFIALIRSSIVGGRLPIDSNETSPRDDVNAGLHFVGTSGSSPSSFAFFVAEASSYVVVADGDKNEKSPIDDVNARLLVVGTSGSSFSSFASFITDDSSYGVGADGDKSEISPRDVVSAIIDRAGPDRNAGTAACSFDDDSASAVSVDTGRRGSVSMKLKSVDPDDADSVRFGFAADVVDPAVDRDTNDANCNIWDPRSS